jgi:hypothetical protein
VWALAVAAVSFPLCAQPVTAGFRAGVPVSPLLTADSPQQAATARYVFGPLVEIRLWDNADIGADPLLRHAGIAGVATSPSAGIWRWETPVSFLYRFHARARPFARGGMTFNRVFDIGDSGACARGPFGEQFYCVDARQVAELRHRGAWGFVAGSGVGFTWKKLRMEPELRLTHWSDRNFGVSGSSLRSNLPQVDLLFGARF